jgi:hypothetical protein
LPDDAKVIPVKRIAEGQIGTLTKIEGFIRIVYIVVLCLGVCPRSGQDILD